MKKYFKHKLENLLVVNKIVTIHYAKIHKNFYHPEEYHDFWELVFAEKNCVKCTADGKEILLKQGETIFHKPNERHSLCASDGNDATIFIASFTCHSPAIRFFENKVIKLTKEQINYVYATVEEAKRTFDIPFFDPDMKKMELQPHPALGGEQLIKNLLELLLIDLMRSLTETESGNKTFLSEREKENKFIGDVINILKNNVYNKITVEDICKKTSYCKAYLFKQFKVATGSTVMAYYLDLKMKEAKKLLKENILSVKEIAESLYFDTPNYFTKTFKKHFGITPTAYKKRASI